MHFYLVHEVGLDGRTAHAVLHLQVATPVEFVLLDLALELHVPELEEVLLPVLVHEEHVCLDEFGFSCVFLIDPVDGFVEVHFVGIVKHELAQQVF